MLESGEKPTKVRLSQKLAYGVGHVFNDICSALWFSYALLFFEVVLKMPSTIAGILIFVGQVVDAIASPIIGILIDRYSTRKLWHLLGTVIIAFTYALIFANVPWRCHTIVVNKTCSDYKTAWEEFSPIETTFAAIYYSFIIAFFQIGWAMAQIAHLAIIPELTPDAIERANLTAIRYISFVCASLLIYLVTWFVLRVTEDEDDILGPDHAYKFKTIVLIGIVVGATCIIWFQVVLEIPHEEVIFLQIESSKSSNWLPVLADYIKRWSLYQVALIYFASRMLSKISLIYIPLYLVDAIKEEPEYIALIPLVSYMASFIGAMFIKKIRAFISSRTNYLFGSLNSIAACMWFKYGFTYPAELYAMSILFGVGTAITGVSSLCLCADLIGTDVKNGAFVYGIVIAADKLFGGIVIITIQYCKTCIYERTPNYHQNVLVYGGGSFIIFGIIILLTMYYGNSNTKEKSTVKEQLSQERNN